MVSAQEVAEFDEFKRVQREREIALTLKKLVIDASCREYDRTMLKRACVGATDLNAIGLIVSPVHIAFVRRQLPRKEVRSISVIVVAGGTGESLISVKKSEVRRALRQGADGVRLVPCNSALLGGEFNYIKREAKAIRKTVKRGSFILSLCDGALKEKDVALGVKAAVAARADGICVRGEIDLVLAAIETAAGRLFVEADRVQNVSQLQLLLRAGVLRAATDRGEKLAEELRSCLNLNQNVDNKEGL